MLSTSTIIALADARDRVDSRDTPNVEGVIKTLLARGYDAEALCLSELYSALQRIARATPKNANTATIDGFISHVKAIANTAIYRDAE